MPLNIWVTLKLSYAFEMRILTTEPYLSAIQLRYASDMRTLTVHPKNKPYLVN